MLKDKRAEESDIIHIDAETGEALGIYLSPSPSSSRINFEIDFDFDYAVETDTLHELVSAKLDTAIERNENR